MKKLIDAEKLKEILLPSYEEAKKESLSATDAVKWEKVEYIFDFVFYLIDSIQQDETQVDKMLCSQVWWEEQGWIMIPPDATYEKIEGELVDWYSTSDGKDYCCGVKTIDSFEAPEGFYIRKK